VELISKIIKHAEKYGNAEVIISSHNASSIVFEHNNLSNISAGKVSEMHIRLSNDGKFGFSKTNNISEWEKCLKNAYSIMKASEPLDLDVVITQKNKYPNVKGIFSKKIENLDKETRLNKMKEMMQVAKLIDNRINISTVESATDSLELQFANSNGVNAFNRSNIISCGVEMNIKDVSGYEMKVSHDLFDFNKIGKSGAELCISSLNPMPVKTMKGDLVLDYFAVADILHTILVPAFAADNVQTNNSFLKGKLGKEVFSKRLTIVDNALLNGGVFSRPFDIEGVKSQKTMLVDKGIVKNYLYDNYSARKDKVKSTGNCAGLQKIPYVGSSNFVVSPGKYSKEQIISETKKGIFAKTAFGTHVANVLTGDVSIGVSSAFYIENGEIVHPIKQAMVSFNLFEALKNIQLIGKELRQETDVVAPILRLDNVQIIGN